MRRARVVVSAVVSILALPSVAIAAWGASGIGDSFIRAVSMPGGATPTLSASGGRAVTVSWTQALLPGGQPVTGYEVARYDGSGNPQSILSACAGTISGLSCTESALPTGTWRYTVTPRQGAWRGAESALSSSVAIAAPSLVLTAPSWITSLPSVLPTTVSNFAAGETITWRLDDPATGTVLTPTPDPFTIPGSGTAAGTVRIPNGTSDGAHTVYAVGSFGFVASAAIAVDRNGPVVSAAALIKDELGTAGYVRPGGSYHVYAAVTDAGSGVSQVTGDTGLITSDSSAPATPFTAGSWTIGGVTYNFRSVPQTAENSLSAGPLSLPIAAVDVVGNVTVSDPGVVVDSTAPSATDVQASNDSGGTAGRAETGDRVTLSFSEALEPQSVVAGWNGASTTVTVRITSQGGSDDKVDIYDAANTTAYSIGTIRLSHRDYASADVSFTGSSMQMVGNTLVFTLGTPNAPASLGTVTVAGGSRYSPSSSMYDRAANGCSAVNANESGASDVEF